jgi:hypothetical protein
MLAPCFVLSEDFFLSIIEYVLFLNVESNIIFFVTFHADHEIVNKSSVHRKILRSIKLPKTLECIPLKLIPLIGPLP